MLKRLGISAFILLFLFEMALAQITWQLDLNVEAEGTNRTVSLGGSPTGTDAFDADLDILSPPAPPSSYYVYFYIDDLEFENLRLDVRHWESPYEATIDWTFMVTHADGIETTITWNSSQLPAEGNFYLINGSELDMRTESSMSVTGNCAIVLEYRDINLIEPEITSIDVNGNHLDFTFTQVDGATGYHVYRGTSYNFVPDFENGTNRIGTNVTDQDGATPGIQWTDSDNVTGDPSVNYYYCVTAVSGSQETAPSNVVGEFDVSLLTTASTDINEVVLVMETSETQSPITTAEELATAIPNCSVVYYWDAAGQGTVGHPTGLPFNNFGVHTGYPYAVSVTADGVWSHSGSVEHVSFDLITTAGTDINHIGIPLNQSDLTTAEELAQDITDCSVVYTWDIPGQGTIGHPTGLPFNNFDVTPGSPYYVNVTSNSTWPAENAASPSLAKKEQPFELSSTRPSGAGIPHLVYGEYKLDDVTGDRNITLRSWISGHEEDILTETHVGAGFDENYWWVGVSNFENTWEPGDVVYTELLVNGGEFSGTQQTMLTTEGADRCDEIVISYTPERVLPTRYALFRNYPNPFNPETHIRYELPEESNVRLDVYDVTGSLVRTLMNKQQSAGRYEVIWNGRNTQGNKVVSGLYFYKMTTPAFTHVQKMMLVK